MNTFKRNMGVFLLSFVVGSSMALAHAGDWHGSAEAGFGVGFGKTTAPNVTKNSGEQWMLDAVRLSKTFEISDSVHVHLAQAMAINSADGGAADTGRTPYNSVNYFSPALLTTATVNSFATFTWAMQEMFIEYMCSSNFKMSFGLHKNPFGHESMGSRYNQKTYYYSRFHTLAQNLNYLYNLGVKFSYENFEMTLFDSPKGTTGTTFSDGSAPGTALRYWFDFDLSGMTLTPVASLYFARFSGEPLDWGATIGFKLASDMWAIDTDFGYLSNKLTDKASTSRQALSWITEANIDFDFVGFSAKYELIKDNPSGRNEHNVAIGLTKMFGKYRTRLLALHSGFSDNSVNQVGFGTGTAAGTNEVRLLVGTEW